MEEFVTVAMLDELPPGSEPIVVEINRRWVAIYNIDGEIYAIEDVCTHDGGPLAEGKLEGCIVECPRHGARFDVRNGKFLTGPAGTIDVAVFAVRLVDNDIQVQVKVR